MNTSFEGNTYTGTDEWLTPPELIKACGEFDLDPCSPVGRPWDTANLHYTIREDGLKTPWRGRVWCNPPYGALAGKFLAKCAEHGNAVALVFSRCETEWFQENVWGKADAILFIKGRIRFYKITGERGGSPGVGSVLIAYGAQNVEALENCGIEGKLVYING